MALTFGLHRTRHCYPLMLITKMILHTQKQEHNCSALIEVDGLDDFTSQLVQRKTNNWEIMLARRKLNHMKFSSKPMTQIEYNIDINGLSDIQLDDIFKDAIDSCNISLLKYMLKKCVDLNKLPSNITLLQVLPIISADGDKKTILSIINLCETLQPTILKPNSGFLHYLAEATWVKGNINEAITMFDTVYRNNIYLRRKVRTMLKFLILTVPNRSEAILVTLINFFENIAVDFKDFEPLMHLWKLCFLSEWYSDQCLAFDLLKRHTDLSEVLSSKLTAIVALALKQQQTDNVYRLLEVLLQENQKLNYSKVLQILFDYRVHQGDLRSCAEIMQWAISQNVDLPALQQQYFINLLLSHKIVLSLNSKATKKTEKPVTLNYKF